jgi:hypothetical protein
MSLVLIVYLIGVLPGLAGAFGFIGFMGTLGLLSAGIGLTCAGNQTSRYSWEDPDAIKVLRGKQVVWGNRCLKGAIITVIIGLIGGLIPSEKTIYTMAAVYAGEKIAQTPAAQQLGNDTLDVLKEILAKAKRELAEDAKEAVNTDKK